MSIDDKKNNQLKHISYYAIPVKIEHGKSRISVYNAEIANSLRQFSNMLLKQPVKLARTSNIKSKIIIYRKNKSADVDNSIDIDNDLFHFVSKSIHAQNSTIYTTEIKYKREYLLPGDKSFIERDKSRIFDNFGIDYSIN